jgi:hypothetical protein
MKQPFSKLPCALQASLVLAGTYVLTIIAISFSAPGVRNFFHEEHWTFKGMKIGFFAMMVLGCGLGYCFPAATRKCLSSIIAAFLAAFSVIGCFLFVVGTHLSVPNEIKLADCPGSVANVHLSAPKGRQYILLLHSPSLGYVTNVSYVSSYKFTGHLRITSNSSQITDIPLNSDKMPVFPSELNLGAVSLQGGKDYDLYIEFNPPPPPSSSISLHWMQNAADKGE